MTDENATSKTDEENLDKKQNPATKEILITKEDPDEIILFDGAIKKKIIKHGNGETPPKGSKVKVHYTGTLESDGSEFDSSRNRNEPFEFKLGASRVIRAWDEGVATMKVGERAILTCRSDFGYGKQGSPPKIPPNATLLFDVELLSFVEDLDDLNNDGGILKKVLKKGEGYKCPNDSGRCMVKYTGTANGKIFTTHTPDGVIELNIDEDLKMPQGLSCALKSMEKGSKSRFSVKSNYAYGSKGNNELGIPPNTDVTYEIEMVSFENDKNTWDMNTQEKLAAMTKLKDKGNAFFKMKLYSKSVTFYEKAINVISEETEKKLSKEEKKTLHVIKVSCYSNTALCKFKEKDYYASIQNCNKALVIQPDHIKALFRRGQAYAYNGDNEESLIDLKTANKLKPDDESIKKLLGIVQKKVRKAKKKQRKHFAGIFNKITLVEEQSNFKKEDNEKEDNGKEDNEKEDNQKEDNEKEDNEKEDNEKEDNEKANNEKADNEKDDDEKKGKDMKKRKNMKKRKLDEIHPETTEEDNPTKKTSL